MTSPLASSNWMLAFAIVSPVNVVTDENFTSVDDKPLALDGNTKKMRDRMRRAIPKMMVIYFEIGRVCCHVDSSVFCQSVCYRDNNLF